jgi:transcriptional regulator with XRE-family HTH domain
MENVKKTGVGQKLKDLRGDRSRDSVAAAVGISSSALGMYENNLRMPRDDIKKKLADFYGVTVQHLFFTE